MSVWWFIRVSVFISVTLFSVIVLGLGAYYVSQFQTFSVPGVLSISVPTWSSLSIAVSAISLLALVPMLLIDFLRKGAFTSQIVVEIIVTFILWVLYLASAAESTATDSLSILSKFSLPESCSSVNTLVAEVEALERSNPQEFQKLGLEKIDFNSFPTLCRAHQASEAFSYIAWVFLMIYCILLLTLAIIAATRGNGKIWTSTVRDSDFFAVTADGKPSLASNSSQAVMTQNYPQTTMSSSQAAMNVTYTPSTVPQVSVVPPQQQPSQQQYYTQAQAPYGAQV